MANEFFEIGQTVYLISGSPKLTVTGINGDDISCSWINVRTREERSWVFERWILTADERAHNPVRWKNPYSDAD